MRNRLTLVDVASSGNQDRLCDAVYAGLSATPKWLPPRLFYDPSGSELFEEITDLPEYYLTRTESAILEQRAGEIVKATGTGLTMVEFGSGSSRKTCLLIEAALARQTELHYVPIDISREFLAESAHSLLTRYEGLSITALAAEYFAAIDEIPAANGPRLILFLGSNIGNLTSAEAVEFLSRVRKVMRPEDRLLVGADQVKDPAVLFAAYNDGQGVTARFNRNLLGRINRELGGGFDLQCFEHYAPWDAEHQRIEMRLVSAVDQAVTVDDLETTFEFAEGEFIRTEWSQKYTAASFASLCAPAGLEIAEVWTDERGWFAEYLLRPGS